MQFPTGGKREFLSPRAKNGRSGVNPEPTVESGWKKQSFTQLSTVKSALNGAFGFFRALIVIKKGDEKK